MLLGFEWRGLYGAGSVVGGSQTIGGVYVVARPTVATIIHMVGWRQNKREYARRMTARGEFRERTADATIRWGGDTACARSAPVRGGAKC